MNGNQSYLWLKLAFVMILASLLGLLTYLTLPAPVTIAQASSCNWAGNPPPPPTGSEVFTLTGVVSSYNEIPVECVQVFAFSGAAQFFTYTDENGEFTLVLEAGVYDLVINPEPGSGLASKGLRGIQTNRYEPITLPPGQTISGTIYADEAKLNPVPGVSIFAFSQRSFSGFGLPTSQTGDYLISLDRDPDYPWELTFTPPKFSGLGPTLVIITVTHDISRDIILEPGFTLWGQVQNRAGGGQANVEVFAQDPTQPKGFGFSPTDAHGNYGGVLPAEGAFDILFFAPPFLGMGSTVITDVSGSGGDVVRKDFMLPVGYTVSGTVRCRFGEPNFFVHAAPEEGVSAGLLGGWGRFASEEGVYALALQPGTYSFEVSAPANSDLRPLEPVSMVITEDMTLNFDYPCVEGTTYAKVVDEQGEPLTKASIFHNGKEVIDDLNGSPITDINGNLVLTNTKVGDTLVALAPLHTQNTVRDGHDGWAYQIYNTNLPIDNAGNIQPFTTITATGPQTLEVKSANTLILFNVIVSIEWDATPEYIDMIEDAFGKAADYLYDVTDGQMSFGRVTIYDKALYWNDADFQISTKNTVRPYAFVGGIVSGDKAHAIRVGRFWDGGSGNTGNWNEKAGYRTLIHEFGHYALHLHDEYFIRKFENGNLIKEEAAACTNVSVKENPNNGATNGSLMYYQYNATELVDSDRWNEDCQNTEQHRVNGKADWQTVLEHYGGSEWILTTPTSPTVRGVMAGPDKFPNGNESSQKLLPFPEIIINNSGQGSGPSLQVTIKDPQGQPVPNALVALYANTPLGKIAVDQGLTDHQGRIAVYGAVPGNQIRSATFDGALSGIVKVLENQDTYEIRLIPTTFVGLSAQANPPTPYLNLIPSSTGDALTLQVRGASDGGILIGIVFSGAGSGAAQSTPLAYSSVEGAYTGDVSFAGVGLGSGSIRVVGVSGDQIISINSNYNLQQIQTITTNHLYSEDGNFELHIPPDGIEASGYSTVLPTGYVPGPLPTDKQVIGSAYEVRLSAAAVTTTKKSLVRLHYHPEIMGLYTDMAIYYWEPNSKTWQKLGGEFSEVDNALSVPVDRVGIYALMGKFSGMPQSGGVYLPIILRNS